MVGIYNTTAYCLTTRWALLIVSLRRLAAVDQPAKPFGFWNSDANNAKYRTNLDPGINSLPGRSVACAVGQTHLSIAGI